ncbi:MAG: hypothetical protein K9L30_06955 [Desulfobacterales bacterium]|nr:hypothetical protein [Desulfobacterales bacterium]
MNKLDSLISIMGNEYKDTISSDSRFYREVDIGEEAENHGFSELKNKYKNVYAVLPLKNPEKGMKVLIDGRTFVNYDQFESGIAVPSYISKYSGLSRKKYTAQDSMILNFT